MNPDRQSSVSADSVTRSSAILALMCVFVVGVTAAWPASNACSGFETLLAYLALILLSFGCNLWISRRGTYERLDGQTPLTSGDHAPTHASTTAKTSEEQLAIVEAARHSPSEVENVAPQRSGLWDSLSHTLTMSTLRWAGGWYALSQVEAFTRHLIGNHGLAPLAVSATAHALFVAAAQISSEWGLRAVWRHRLEFLLVTCSALSQGLFSTGTPVETSDLSSYRLVLTAVGAIVAHLLFPAVTCSAITARMASASTRYVPVDILVTQGMALGTSYILNSLVQCGTVQSMAYPLGWEGVSRGSLAVGSLCLITIASGISGLFATRTGLPRTSAHSNRLSMAVCAGIAPLLQSILPRLVSENTYIANGAAALNALAFTVPIIAVFCMGLPFAIPRLSRAQAWRIAKILFICLFAATGMGGLFYHAITAREANSALTASTPLHGPHSLLHPSLPPCAEPELSSISHPGLSEEEVREKFATLYDYVAEVQPDALLNANQGAPLSRTVRSNADAKATMEAFHSAVNTRIRELIKKRKLRYGDLSAISEVVREERMKHNLPPVATAATKQRRSLSQEEKDAADELTLKLVASVDESVYKYIQDNLNNPDANSGSVEWLVKTVDKLIRSALRETALGRLLLGEEQSAKRRRHLRYRWNELPATPEHPTTAPPTVPTTAIAGASTKRRIIFGDDVDFAEPYGRTDQDQYIRHNDRTA